MGTWNVNGGQNRRMYLNWKEDNFVQIITISLTLNWNAKLPNLSDTQQLAVEEELAGLNRRKNRERNMHTHTHP